MEWPKRARTADWENGVLALDREKQFEVPKLTAEIMERLAGYTLVGFHVKGYPVTDELLAPFAGHKSMVNFGVENGALTDACFPFFSAMPKLRYLLLTGNAGIDGSGLSALQSCKLDLLALDHTRLEDAGLLRAASIPKLSHIWIDHTAVTYYRVHKKPMIELANGWYHIEILGGETLQDGDYEPTFEFVIQPATNEEATINADMNFSFEITSSAY